MALMSNTLLADTQTCKSPLLATPPEILVLIAECVANVSISPYMLTLYKASDNATLVNLSLVNKAIRHACISAGLFNNCTLPAHKAGPSLDLDDLCGIWPLRITSLGIDLGNPNLWDSCAHIMGNFPDLDKLVLSGRYPNRLTSAFLESELATKFRFFKGTSVVLRGASLTSVQSQILFLIGGSNVRAFTYLECHLRQNGHSGVQSQMWDCLFPKLQSFMISLPSIREKDWVKPAILIDSVLGLYPEIRPQLLRFEWSFGSKARFCKDRTTGIRRGPPRFVTNRTCERELMRMLKALQLRTYKSLEVFIDGDSLGGDMVDIAEGLIPHVQVQQSTPYEKMKLLVFRCEIPQDLATGDESDTCAVENDARASEVEQKHPVWDYVHNPLSFHTFSTLDIHHVRLFLVMRLYIH